MTKAQRLMNESKALVALREEEIEILKGHIKTLLEHGNDLAGSLQDAMAECKTLGDRNIEMKDEIRKLINAVDNLAAEI